MEKTAYEILGLNESATNEEIKRRYHTLMRNISSDSEHSQEENTLIEIKAYNDAYDQLSKEKRMYYDSELTWILSKKSQLEVELKNLKNEIEIEFMKKSSTNQIQLELDSKNLGLKITQLEQKRKAELQRLQQRYFGKFNKRFMTEKKRKKLEQQYQHEEEIMNAKYKLLSETHNQERAKIELDLAEYQRALEAEFENNLKVRELSQNLKQVITEMHSIEET